MLLRKRKITREFIHMLDGWRHSGFSVFAGERIQPREKKSLENLAAYLIRPTFSQQRMEYRTDQEDSLFARIISSEYLNARVDFFESK